MINQDFAEFPEHRVGFFKLLRAINLNCFPGTLRSSFLSWTDLSLTTRPCCLALLALPAPQFKLFMDSISWAIKHTMRDIVDTGLNCAFFTIFQLRMAPLTKSRFRSCIPKVCIEVINNFAAADQGVATAFFQQYYLSLLQDTFFVLTDADHKSGFKLQCLLLSRMIQLVATNAIQAPLFDPSTVTDPNQTNVGFVREYTANLLKSAFPHAAKYAPLLFLLSVSSLTDILVSIARISRPSCSTCQSTTATLTGSSLRCVTSSSSSRSSRATTQSSSSTRKRLRRRGGYRRSARPRCASRVCSSLRKWRTRTRISKFEALCPVG